MTDASKKPWRKPELRIFASDSAEGIEIREKILSQRRQQDVAASKTEKG